jgi:peptidoglycan-associated lipoprotein
MMSKSRLRSLNVATALAAFMLLAGCHHKAPPPPPPPPRPAPPAAPTVEIHANPTAIERGQSSTLTWRANHAASVTLNGTRVDVNGSQQVSPTQSTDYQVIARNAAGQSANASVRVTVTEPPPPPAPAPAPQAENIDEAWNRQVKDAFFDYDKSDIRSDAQTALQADANFLKAHPDVNVIIEGHCDERGSAEYNMGLGDRRANAARDYLVRLGVDGSRIRTISYGKEKPYCTEHNEDCWQQNRRAHLARATGG